MFAAALPVPVHHMPGGTLATGIRDALTASSFRAHVAGKPCDETPAPSLLWGTLTVETPGSAGGRRCVDAREIHRLAPANLSFSEWLDVVLSLAGVDVTPQWRNLRVRAGNAFTAKPGPIWLALNELDKVLPQMPGH